MQLNREVTMSSKVTAKNIVNDAIIKEIRDAIETLEYGDVTIKVHNSRITQIEVAKRKRFDNVWHIDEGGGI
jgi:hypothetical protein